MDPYVKVELGTQSYKTKTHHSGGKNPVWSDVFELLITNEETLYLRVYDKDLLKDDHVGSGTFSISQLLTLPSYHFAGNVPLMYKNKSAGEIYIDIVFYPNQPPMMQHGHPHPEYSQPGYPQPGYPQPGYPQPGYPQPYPMPGPMPDYPQPSYPTHPHQGYPGGYLQPGMPAGYPQQYPQSDNHQGYAQPGYHPRPY